MMIIPRQHTCRLKKILSIMKIKEANTEKNNDRFSNKAIKNLI